MLDGIPTVFQIALLSIQALALVVFGVIGYFAAETRRDVKDLAASVKALEVMMVSKFVTIETFNVHRSEIRRDLERLQDRVQSTETEIAILHDRTKRDGIGKT